MKKYLGIFGALALAACGSNGGGPLNLGTLTTALFTAANMSGAANTACPAAAAQVDTVTVDTPANTTDYTVTINGTAYTITSDASGTTAEVSAALVACINNGGADCKGSTPAAGNTAVTAADTTSDFTLTADVAGTPFTATEVDANLTLVATTPNAGCNGVLDDTYGADDDTTAIVDFLLTAGTSPSETDMFECATGAVPAGMGDTDLDCTTFALDLPMNSLRVVSLSATQKVNCNGATAVDGTITVVDTVTGTVVDASNVESWVPPSDTTDMVWTQTITAVNCKITGDLGLIGGSAATTIVINGSVTIVDREGHLAPTAADPNTFSATGNFTVTPDLSGGAPTTDTFWTDQINFNASGVDDGTPTMNGGVCLGSAVALGADNAVDTDDDCAVGTDQFVPVSDLP